MKIVKNIRQKHLPVENTEFISKLLSSTPECEKFQISKCKQLCCSMTVLFWSRSSFPQMPFLFSSEIMGDKGQ